MIAADHLADLPLGAAAVVDQHLLARLSAPSPVRNPDPSKRNRPTLGIPILLGLRTASDNRWEGKVYNAENGSLYQVHVSRAREDVLRIEGCILGGLFCGGQNWRRASVPGDQVAQTQGRGSGRSKSAAPGGVNVCAAAAQG